MKNLQSKGIILVVSILMFTINSFGQGISVTQKIEKKNAIVFSPLNMFNPANPSLDIAYERALNDKYTLQVEAGYMLNQDLAWAFSHLLLNTRNILGNKGFKLSSELQYSVINRENFSIYNACELFYLKNNSSTYTDFTIPIIKIKYKGIYNNKQEKMGLNLKTGLKLYAGNYFFDFHLGVGVAYQTNKNPPRRYTDNGVDKNVDKSFANPHVQGSHFVLNYPMNIKVGYRF